MDAKERAREQRLKKFFNLTIDLWNAIDSYQNHVCFVCHKPQLGKRLAVDHSHTSGLLRSLLCSTCNRILGKIERTWSKDTDIILMLERIILMLRNPPITAALGREVYTFPGRFGTKRHKKYLKESMHP